MSGDLQIRPRGIETPYKRLGEFCVRRRKALGWTQQELADRMGLVRSSIANIETGRQRLLLHDALALMFILGSEDATQLFYDAITGRDQ